MAAIGGITMATRLIAIASGVENKRTTNQATMIRPRQVAISTK
jgi:hypothetical protein